jgi:hypothetical protein
MMFATSQLINIKNDKTKTFVSSKLLREWTWLFLLSEAAPTAISSFIIKMVIAWI